MSSDMCRYIVCLLCFTECHGWLVAVTRNSDRSGRLLIRRNNKFADDEGNPSEAALPFQNDVAKEITDEDPVVLKTKTEKNIVYDEGSGRFFESDKESPNALVPREADEENRPFVTSLPPGYSPTDMVPTDTLFQRDITRRLQQKEKDEKEKLELSRIESIEKKKRKEISEKTQEMTSQNKTPKADTNKMIPTEILFSNDIKEKIEMKSVPSDDTTERANALEPDAKGKTPPNHRTSKSIVELCYEAWNERDMDAVVACFERTNFQSYHDTLYWDGNITSRDALKDHFTKQANLLPGGSKIVVKNIAIDEKTVGTQWAVHSSNGSSEEEVPYTNGCSFYELDETTGLITKGVRASEMWLKPSADIANFLAASAANIWGSEKRSSRPKPITASVSSIIERYFDSWNNRDFDSALDCFVDDCVYQTEDPVFVNQIIGKDALRKHLVQNAESLPPACCIVLDNIALGDKTIGTTWHLEINNFVLLSGLSMYTMDGPLLKTGYDVTEAPLKFPRSLLPSFSFPAKLLFGF